MSNEFVREERYIVFKISDVERYLTDKDRANITMMKMEIDAGRDCANKPPFKGLIVEADWPEYEPTWKAIEARVTGAQPAPSTKDAIIDDLQSQFDSDGITEHDSGDALIRLSDAIAAVEDNFAGAQPAPSFADAYQGAMEEVAIWKKRALEVEDLNRKFIAEINGPTYMGEQAQPAPSVPDGWLRAIDEALVVAHVGVANAHDTYEQAKAKLDNLIGFHVDVATDPAVNGGWQLAPIEPMDVIEQAVNRFLSWKLPKDFHPDGGMVFIPTKGRGYDSPHWPVGTNLLNAQQAREMLRYVLAAAPEAKP